MLPADARTIAWVSDRTAGWESYLGYGPGVVVRDQGGKQCWRPIGPNRLEA